VARRGSVRRVTEQVPSEESNLDNLAAVDLNLLVPLMALLEERSVTRAAARVGLSQPAMSHALARLRRLLGDDLLVRQGSTMALTPRAGELVAPLRHVLAQTAKVVHFPGFDPGTDSRVITVSLTASTAIVVGGHVARLVAERAPHATLRLLTAALPDETAFTEQGADVVLATRPWPSAPRRERLYEDRYVVIAAQDAAPADASAVDLLQSLPHVMWEASRQRVQPYAVLAEHGIDYVVGQVVQENFLIPPLVAQVGGVAVHRHRIATSMSARFPLRIEEFPFPVPGLGVDMVWNPRLTDDGFVAWLRRVLQDAAAEVVATDSA
jgi:DNA-binding transcriptional LysR family regulator